MDAAALSCSISAGIEFLLFLSDMFCGMPCSWRRRRRRTVNHVRKAPRQRNRMAPKATPTPKPIFAPESRPDAAGWAVEVAGAWDKLDAWGVAAIDDV